MAVLGVDGWRGRWVGERPEGQYVRLMVLEDVAAVLAVPDVELIAIDMPIGLSETGRRTCDDLARKRLGRAGSSVFPALLRQVLAAGDYALGDRPSGSWRCTRSWPSARWTCG
ncbi:DUF429 domain-containing protein [Blastococcus sp. LR1]|uniref:DUF429 domain-containing protein n=1 Tax=Blastococcus sp. LR1 TaxID=2877000 RepID=UPI0027DF5808|nr:DUF429 domain-containing protein [Blastococcus sp. LR1]